MSLMFLAVAVSSPRLFGKEVFAHVNSTSSMGYGDVTNLSVCKNLVSVIVAGCVLAVMLSPPCTSFSQARDRHHEIRSKDFPWGFPAETLSDADEARIKSGNATARAAFRIMRACLKHNVPFIMENPCASKIFLLPPLLSILAKPGVGQLTLDQCQYGSTWKKRTSLVHFAVDDLHLLDQRCRTRGGICSKTRLPHFQLQGIASSGIHWTNIDQAFPHNLAVHLAWCLLQNAFFQRTLRIEDQLRGVGNGAKACL